MLRRVVVVLSVLAVAASADAMLSCHLLTHAKLTRTCSGSSRPLALCTARSSRKQSSRLMDMQVAPTNHGEPGQG